jgi:hypothetical protein
MTDTDKEKIDSVFGKLGLRVLDYPSNTKGKTMQQVKISIDDVLEAVEADDYVGFCLACGESQGQVEPDANRLRCESCGVRAVAGAEYILVVGAYSHV